MPFSKLGIAFYLLVNSFEKEVFNAFKFNRI